MTTTVWLNAPVGIDSSRWITRSGCRTILAVAHTAVSCGRLLDVLDLVEDDPRVQVVFTVAPDAFNHGVPSYLDSLGALVVPWTQAVRERFDLAVAAAYGGLTDLHAPIMLMSHGAGHGRRHRPRLTDGRRRSRPTTYGLDAQRLTRDGAVLPTVLLLAHDRELEILRRQCPEALPAARVVGDPCFDRLVGSIPERGTYRAALGVSEDRALVVVSSTWGPHGLFGGVPDLLPRLLDELPAARFQVAALLHPAVWEAHGRRQVRAWTRECRDAGLILAEPAHDWRAYVVAADHVVGDHGSVTAYAAAIRRRVLHLPPAGGAVTAPGSPHQLLRGTARRLDPRAPLLPQLRAARPVDPGFAAAALTSRPGRAHSLIRRELYELLRLAEPGRHRRLDPVPPPAVQTNGAPK